MPSWRPDTPGLPNGANEKHFVPLDSVDPDLAADLVERYGRRWLAVAGLPEHRQPEVPDTVELLVAPDFDRPPKSGLPTLRLTSWYTGSTYWLWHWDGCRESAERWIDEVADHQAANVESERSHLGPTPWDDEG